MTLRFSPLYIFITCLLLSCSSAKYVNQGKVASKDFYYKTTYTTAKTIMLVPCEFEGETKNFLFDTGAELTVVVRDSIFGERFTVRGATKRTMESGSETLSSLKIGDVDFVNTFANNSKLDGLKEKIPDFGGIMGRPIINKANWLIDTKNKTFAISDRDLSDDSFVDLPMEGKKGGAPYTLLTIEGKEYKVILDFGSSSTFNVPNDTELASILLSKHDFKDHSRKRYTVGGLQTITEKLGAVPSIRIGELEFKDVKTNINISSQPRIGMSFFEGCRIYIDNKHRRWRVNCDDR